MGLQIRQKLASLGALFDLDAFCRARSWQLQLLFPAIAMQRTPLSRASSADALSINSDNVHCYYSTVQSEVHPQELVDTALARRHARAVEHHRRQRVRPARVAWIAGGVLAVVCLMGWAWLAP